MASVSEQVHKCVYTKAVLTDLQSLCPKGNVPLISKH